MLKYERGEAISKAKWLRGFWCQSGALLEDGVLLTKLLDPGFIQNILHDISPLL